MTATLFGVALAFAATIILPGLGYLFSRLERKYRSHLHPKSMRLTRFDEEFLRSHAIDTEDAETVSRRQHPSVRGRE